MEIASGTDGAVPTPASETRLGERVARTVIRWLIGSPCSIHREVAMPFPAPWIRSPHPVAVSFVVVMAATVASVGWAAPDAGAKARGEYNFYGHSAHHSFSSARANTETYQRYINETHGVPFPTAPVTAADPASQTAAQGAVDPEIAREAGDAIADDIERIQRHVNRMRASAKSTGDTAALAKLDDVDKQLGVARRSHAALHEHHAGETIAPATAMSLAQKVNDSLRAAHREHDEVLKQLGASAQP
jgi:hypothetical protein